ncbi:glycosyltransferase [Rhodococcoides fascians]|uniref:glycosyltransferase n=1 Tax=Rhodococcoides fascians TaxID=1828 RepID=UPI0015C61FFD|nr:MULTISPECIES: glycosyltransferase [Rhodococcus]
MDDGQPWPGIGQFSVNVKAIRRGELPEWKLPQPGVKRIVWVSKGISPLAKIVEKIREADDTVIVVLDLDDDDAALAADFRSTSITNWLRLNPARRMYPGRIRSAQHKIADVADLFTFSSNVLASRFPGHWVPTVRITHARPIVAPVLPTPVPGLVRIGTFGTIRGHKGARRLSELMEFSDTLELHTFKNSGVSLSAAASERHIEHEPGTPLSEVYSAVDVAYIPMSTNSGADVQLPAKLIDAMAIGVPIVTSPTSAIVEVAGDSVHYASLTLGLAETISILATAAARHERNAHLRFLQVASSPVLAKDLMLAIHEIIFRDGAAADV